MSFYDSMRFEGWEIREAIWVSVRYCFWGLWRMEDGKCGRGFKKVCPGLLGRIWGLRF
jgi:hypothetical protein